MIMAKTNINKVSNNNKRRVNILKRKIVTVDDLLTQSDVNDALSMISEIKSEVKTLIIIYVKKDGNYNTITTDSVTNGDLNWYLDQVKDDILHDNDG
jgi:hypothetical protein